MMLGALMPLHWYGLNCGIVTCEPAISAEISLSGWFLSAKPSCACILPERIGRSAAEPPIS